MTRGPITGPLSFLRRPGTTKTVDSGKRFDAIPGNAKLGNPGYPKQRTSSLHDRKGGTALSGWSRTRKDRSRQTDPVHDLSDPDLGLRARDRTAEWRWQDPRCRKRSPVNWCLGLACSAALQRMRRLLGPSRGRGGNPLANGRTRKRRHAVHAKPRFQQPSPGYATRAAPAMRKRRIRPASRTIRARAAYVCAHLLGPRRQRLMGAPIVHITPKVSRSCP